MTPNSSVWHVATRALLDSIVQMADQVLHDATVGAAMWHNDTMTEQQSESPRGGWAGRQHASRAEDWAALGRRARRRREALGKQQQDVEAETELSRSWLSRFENGGMPNGPRLGDLAILARWLRMPLDELYYGSTDADTERDLRRLMQHQDLAPSFADICRDWEESSPADRAWIQAALDLIAQRRASKRLPSDGGGGVSSEFLTVDHNK